MMAIDEKSQTVITNITEKLPDNVNIVEDFWVEHRDNRRKYSVGNGCFENYGTIKVTI